MYLMAVHGLGLPHGIHFTHYVVGEVISKGGYHVTDAHVGSVVVRREQFHQQVCSGFGDL